MKPLSICPILTAWRRVCTERSGEAAVLDSLGRCVLSFEKLNQRADQIAEQFQQLDGVDQRHQSVVLFSDNHPLWIPLFLATRKLGWTFLGVEKDCRSPISGSEVIGVRFVDVSVESALQFLPATEHGDANGPGPSGISGVDRNCALIKLSSGTTGLPKTLLFNADVLAADCEQVVSTMGLRSGERNLAAIPFSHSYGFSNLVTPLLMHGMPVVLPEDLIPANLAAAVTAGAVSVFPAVPVFLRLLVASENARSLEPLRLVISAGAPLSPAVAGDFLNKFKVPIRVFYGSSECGGIAFDRSDPPVYETGFVGQPMDGVGFAPNADGTVTIRSAAVGGGEDSFTPPDLLEPHPLGWKIVGRLSDRIHVGGRKLDPLTVEAVLQNHRAVRETVVFGAGSERKEQQVIAAVVDAEEPVSDGELRQWCARSLPGWQIPAKFWRLKSIPSNARGKISRRDLAGRFEKTFEVITPPGKLEPQIGKSTAVR